MHGDAQNSFQQQIPVGEEHGSPGRRDLATPQGEASAGLAAAFRIPACFCRLGVWWKAILCGHGALKVLVTVHASANGS